LGSDSVLTERTLDAAFVAELPPRLIGDKAWDGGALQVRLKIPAGEYEELVATWLWSEQQGVFLHQTALFLHGVADALPSRVHSTLPTNWRRRRLRIPAGRRLPASRCLELR
jgi:hypothetical protein